MKRKKKSKVLAWTMISLLFLATMPAGASSVHPVTEQERGFVGATHVATITYADLTETNVNTAQTLTDVFNVTANQRIELIGMELITAFDAGNNATGSVLVTVGDAAAGTDFYLDSAELNSNKTEVWMKYGRGFQGVTTATRTNVTAVSQQTTTLNYAGTNAPTVTVTPQTTTLNYAGTNAPTVTVTPQTTTLNYAGTNAPTVTVTPQTTTLNYAGTNAPTVTVVPVLATNTIVYLDGSSNIVTNTIVYVASATATATLTAGSLAVATNATATATLTAGSLAVATNATATATLTAGSLAVATNATATATLTAGSLAVGTNVAVTTAAQASVTALTDSAQGRKVYTVDDTIDFVFTPNAANALSENTTGEVKFYFKVIR